MEGERRPYRYANQLPEQVEAEIVAAKREKPNWGARKIRERLLRSLRSEIKVPARSTIHAILDRHGLVSRASRPRRRAEGTALSAGLVPNTLWCTDYKGEFKLGNKSYCYPLTVTDHATRYLLLCEAMESNKQEFAFNAFERLFHERGLPQAIRSDNGVPFASPNGLFNLYIHFTTRRSWLRIADVLAFTARRSISAEVLLAKQWASKKLMMVFGLLASCSMILVILT